MLQHNDLHCERTPNDPAASLIGYNIGEKTKHPATKPQIKRDIRESLFPVHVNKGTKTQIWEPFHVHMNPIKIQVNVQSERHANEQVNTPVSC